MEAGGLASQTRESGADLIVYMWLKYVFNERFSPTEKFRDVNFSNQAVHVMGYFYLGLPQITSGDGIIVIHFCCVHGFSLFSF